MEKPSSSSSSSLRRRLLLLVSLLSLLCFFSASALGTGSIHELLRANGLPGGLLPKNVESFSLDPATGLLVVQLDGPCYAKYDGPAFFDREVRGNLSYGALGGVVGLKQEELFLWLPVKGILVSDPASGVILFDIGLARKRLSLSLFEEPPDCRPEYGRSPGLRKKDFMAGERGDSRSRDE